MDNEEIQEEIQGVKFSEFLSVTPGNSDEVVGLHAGDNARFSVANFILAIRQGLASIFVPLTRTINGKSLGSDVTLVPTDVGAQEEITASGILKGDGQGGVSTAVAGTDYATPGQIPSVPSPSNLPPLEDGIAESGAAADYSRADHVHPHDSIKANHAEFAYLETGPTASRAYGIGEYFTQKTSGRLLRVIEPISAGNTFTPGTNCEYTTVGSELQDKPKSMIFNLQAGKTLTITKTAGALYSYLIGGAGPAAFGSLWWVMGYSNTGTQTKLVTLSTANNLVITNAAASITVQNTHPSQGARVTVLVLGYEGTLPTYTVS